MNEKPRPTEFGEVFFELMREKGVGGLNEFVALAEEAGHEITVEEFDGLVYKEGEMLPSMGVGVTIREVLRLNEEEEQRLFEGFVAYYES